MASCAHLPPLLSRMKRHPNCSVVLVAHLAACEKEGLIRNGAADNFGVPYTILLVEDETFVRQSIEAALCLYGYTVLTAVNATQALEICRNSPQPPDLLVSDMVMPGMSGGELARAFRVQHPQAGVLLMSGYAEELTPHASSACCTPYLRKPFSVDTLIKAVSELLDVNARSTKTVAAKVWH
jgi:DNA-binding NtrC family response regulator